jgi:polygalacturonase
MPAPHFLFLCTLLAAGSAAARAADITVTTFGAVPDGTTLNTETLQKAIDACASQGGGTVRFPPGRYLSGTLQLKSRVTLHLEEGAILLGSTNPADYRNVDPFMAGDGIPQGHAFIVAVDADHVGIEGKGTIDGQGPALRRNQTPFRVRPFLIRWIRCANVSVKGLHLTNPGAWTLNFFRAKDVAIEGLTIRTRNSGLPNNDGINIDSSENVTVTNCDVNSGDDALVIKSTSRDHPTRNITASDCKLATSTNAIKLGTESIGGFENVTIRNCQVTRTGMAGIALYEVDGADLQKIAISDITMDGVIIPISIRLGARLKTFREGDQPRPAPGRLGDISIKNVTAKNVRSIGILINGVPNHCVENVTLENIALELPGGGTEEMAKVQLPEREAAYPEHNMFGNTMPAYGTYIRHARNITLTNVKTTLLKPDARPEAVRIDVHDVP